MRTMHPKLKKLIEAQRKSLYNLDALSPDTAEVMSQREVGFNEGANLLAEDLEKALELLERAKKDLQNLPYDNIISEITTLLTKYQKQ